jgi:hypothetical protein
MSVLFAQDPKQLWGNDLAMIFGPVGERRPISELTYDEKQEIIKSVPEYVSTKDLGPSPSLYQVVNKVLKVLKQSKAVFGIDLNWQEETALMTLGLERPREMYKSTDKMYKNNAVQRGIMLRHLLEDILFVYEPKKVLNGLARYSVVEDRFYMNDAQHRNVASIILGVRYIPVEFEQSESQSVDVEQYGCVNIGSLVASEFDKYRNRVQQYLTRQAEGLDVNNLGPAVETAHAVYQIVEVSYGIEFVEKGGEILPRTCTGIANALRDYDRYGSDIFSRAVSIVASQTVNVRNRIPQQMIEMVCRFLKSQQASSIDEFVMDMAVEEALEHWCPKKDKTGLYLDANRACINGPFNDDSDMPLMSDALCDLQTRWAAGVLKLVRVTNPNLEWEPIKVKGVDIAERAMPGFVVMPKFEDKMVA